MANERNLKPFKKGQDVRRNTAGRPKITAISEALRIQLAATMKGKDEQTVAEKIAQIMIDRALGGDLMAAKEVIDRVEGKAKQALSVDLSVTDWREIARSEGLSEDDVIREANQLIQQSALDSSDAQSDK